MPPPIPMAGNSTDLQTSHQICKKIMKVVSMNQCQIILTSFQNFNGALDKFLMHYCRMSMIQKWKRSTDKGRNFAAVLTDLSKAFGFPPHDLINAKPNLLNANPTKWSNTLKQCVGNSGQIVPVCWTILWDWHLTLFKVDLFGLPLSKICHTHPQMMKLSTVIPYLKTIQKIYSSRDTPLEFCWHQHFFNGNQQLLLDQVIQI